MATRNVVPRADGEGGIGTAVKHWGAGYFNTLPNWQEYLAESTGYGIISGCEPTISGLTVTVGAGIVHLADGTRKESSASTVTLDAADSTNPRIDLVYIDSTGVVAKITGTAAVSPSAPSLPSGGISVATVSVAANATTGTVTDMRDMLPRWFNTGIVNVKDFGAVGNGVHDDTAAIQAACQVAANNQMILLIPDGDFIFSGTIANIDILILGKVSGSIVFNDSLLLTNRRHIFSTSSNVSGYIRNDKIFPEWFGAKAIPLKKKTSDGYNAYHDIAIDSSDAIQAALDFANCKSENGNKIGTTVVSLGAGFYRVDKKINDHINGNPAIIKGQGMNATVLDFSALSQESIALEIGNGIGGSSYKGIFENFYIYGNTTTTLIGMIDCLGYKVKNVRFGTAACGVLFKNNISGSYSEQDKIIDCYFEITCVLKGHYAKNEGDASFHGSGFINCFAEHNLDNAPVILIDSGCSPYNANLELNLHLRGNANPIIENNGTYVTFIGNLQLEGTTEDTIITNPGPLNFAGPIMTWAGVVSLGSMFRVSGYTSIPTRRNPEYLPRTYAATFDAAKTFPNGNSGGQLIAVEVQTTNYAYRGLIVAYTEHNDSVTNFFEKLIDTIKTDTNNYGKPTYTSNGNGDLTITPPASLPSTAKLYVRTTEIGVPRRYLGIAYRI